MSELLKSYHEASHAVIAWVLNEFVIIDHLTLDRERMQNPNRHPDDEGELYLRTRRNEIINKEAAYMVIWAGVIGVNIFKEGVNVIRAKRTKITSDPYRSLDLVGFEGDEDVLEEKGLNVIDHLLIKYVINLLINPKIWRIVESLSETLIAKEDKSMNEEELNNFFEEESQKSFMYNARESLIAEFKNPYRVGAFR